MSRNSNLLGDSQKRQQRDQSENEVGICFPFLAWRRKEGFVKSAEAVLWSDSWEMQHICQRCCKLERCSAVLGMREREGLVQLSSSAGQIFED